MSAQKTTIFTIDGNKMVDEEFYKNTIKQNLSKSKSEIENIIIRKHAQMGLYNSEINELSIDITISQDSIFVKLSLKEWEPTYIKNIIFDSLSTADSEFVNDQLMSLYDEIFYESEFESKIESLLNNYENSGYPFVNITIKSVHFYQDDDSNNVVDVFINIDKEQIRRIDKVEITGNTKTNEKVII
ncbi:MAG: hypothetical protein OQJ81_00615, partial [Melioribacteraceae bacterium]|nr:hypothetical protein [Melioribacteraceae bacterium]